MNSKSLFWIVAGVLLLCFLIAPVNAISVSGITPSYGINTDTALSVTISGSGFSGPSGANSAYILYGSGPAINCNGIVVSNDNSLTCSLSLYDEIEGVGAPTGYYDVWVKNLMSQSGVRYNAFEVRPPLQPPVAEMYYYFQDCQIVQFYYESSSGGYPDSWDWNFGDGTHSTEQNPIHSYSSPGPYYVILTVTNSAGADTTPPQTVTAPTGSYTVDSDPQGTNIYYVGEGWDFSGFTTPHTFACRDDGSYYMGAKLSGYYDQQADIEVAGGGNSVQLFKDWIPAGDFVATYPGASGPHWVDFDYVAPSSDPPNPMTNYWYWNFGDGTTTDNWNAPPTSHWFADDPGTYTVTLIAENNAYDSGFITKQVTLGGGGTPAPTVTSISPASGPSIGGTVITITGTDLTGATAVKFGGTDATTFTPNSATSITATAPASAGTVDVTVTTPGGTSTVVAGDQFTYLTGRAGARAYAIDKDFGGDPTKPENANKELQVSDTLLPANTVLKLGNGQTCQAVDYDAWVDTTNNDKNANLGTTVPPAPKQFTNTFYADGKAPVVCSSDFPPIDIAMSHAAGNIPNSGGWTNINDPPGPDPVCPNPVATNNYALLISGGGTKETNYNRYYNDIQFLYKTLINDYKYDPTHIRVLLSDGLDDAADQLVINTDGSKSYINSEQNLDGAGGDDVWGAADYANISKALGAANGWSSLGSTNTLLIFTTGHGEQVDTANAATNANAVNLLLWQTKPYSATEKITDTQFASLLPANPKIILVMEQCYGGGFKNNVIVSGKVRSLAAAALGSQTSHSNDFSYPYITADSQHDSAGNPMYAAETSGDGLIQTLEAFTYAYGKDPSRSAGTETPTNNPIGTGADALTLVTCGSGKSITSVLAKTPTPWVAGQSGTATWAQTGLTGQNVQIDIMKGTGAGVWQATFGTTKSATILTSTATVPSVMTTAPGSVTNDYWLRITTTGTLRPQVIGTSGTFTITGVTGGTPATLTINKDSTGKSSLITIIDTSNGQEVQTGSSTLHTYSLPGGSYKITLSRSCTIPMVPQLITLGSGAVVTKTYPLTDVSAADCKNGISTAEFGSIDISSLPDMGYHVYLKHASDPATLYQDIGSDTPTIWNVLPGDWTVKLEAPGYMPGEQNVHVDAGDTTIADFTLKKIDVNAQVLIVPQPLNIGRTGYFLAFVKLPTGYKAADVDAGKVYCEGAKALKVIRINLFPHIFVAIFQRRDLVPYVLPKDQVTLHVTGEIKKSTGNLVFMGSNTIKVLSQKVTTKEDVDNVMSLTDTQIFTKFNKF